MRGRLIVFEGTDGSGKATQSKLLYERLFSDGYNVKKFSFPDYDDPSSTLLKMYLGGEFGDKPDSVNCYVASSFFTVDRIASYLKKWKEDLDSGAIIILDRYTSSNMVHQTSKLSKDKWDEYLEWLYDFEFIKMQLPAPDLTLYLHVDVDMSEKMMAKRYSNDETKKDIHEKDSAYLRRCEESGMYAAKKFDWRIVECVDNGALRSIEDIGNEISRHVSMLLNDYPLKKEK